MADTSLSVTVLGSSGTYATPGRAASGYLVEVGNRRIWLDAGAGTWQNLLRRVAYQQVDGVMLSHEHPDHTSDVLQLYHARQYGGREPLDPIPLWAPQDTWDRLARYARGVGDAFRFSPVAAGDTIDLAGARWSFYEMEHPVDTVGVRIETGSGVFAYSADTGTNGDLKGLAADASVFVCEATFQDCDGPWSGHMSASEAAFEAARLGVSRLVLTHLPPGRDLEVSLEEARRDAGNVDVMLAQDGMRLEVGP